MLCCGNLFLHIHLQNIHHINLVSFSKQAHLTGIDSEIQDQINLKAWAILESIAPYTNDQGTTISSKQFSFPDFDSRDSFI